MIHDILFLALAFGAGSIGVAGLAHAGVSIKGLLTKAKSEAQGMETPIQGYTSDVKAAAVVPADTTLVVTPTTAAAA